MKVGDYVRTEYGISKCIKVIPIRENSFMYEFDKEVYEDVNYLTASELEKYKSSPNIIDLIEVGDFINGECVLEITEKEKTPGFKRYFVTWRCAVYGERIDEYELKRILETIVTKERFEAMEYKCE